MHNKRSFYMLNLQVIALSYVRTKSKMETKRGGILDFHEFRLAIEMGDNNSRCLKWEVAVYYYTSTKQRFNKSFDATHFAGSQDIQRQHKTESVYIYGELKVIN